MTLILTAITPEHIVQVSDMKLTLPTGEVADDHAAKMVLWCGRTLVAYTGLACIHATRTDVWLAEVLAQAVSFENGVRRIRQRLTATLAGDRHLEVMLAGWVKTEPDGDCKPVVAEVSNVRDWDWSHPPRRYFESTTRLVPSHAVGHLGQPLLAEVECVLADRLAASGDHPAVMANAMVEAVRSLAEVNRRVGRALLVGSVPRAAVPVDATVSLGYVDWSRGMFLHVPERSDDPIVYGPDVVCHGAVMAGVRVMAGDGESLPPFILNYPCS